MQPTLWKTRFLPKIIQPLGGVEGSEDTCRRHQWSGFTRGFGSIWNGFFCAVTC
jgi:hypothetical protein